MVSRIQILCLGAGDGMNNFTSLLSLSFSLLYKTPLLSGLIYTLNTFNTPVFVSNLLVANGRNPIQNGWREREYNGWTNWKRQEWLKPETQVTWLGPASISQLCFSFGGKHPRLWVATPRSPRMCHHAPGTISTQNMWNWISLALICYMSLLGPVIE